MNKKYFLILFECKFEVALSYAPYRWLFIHGIDMEFCIDDIEVVRELTELNEEIMNLKLS